MIDEIKQRRVRLEEIAKRFSLHDFEYAPPPSRTPPLTNRYVAIYQLRDLCGDYLTEGEQVLVQMLLGACHTPATRSHGEAHWHESCASQVLQHFYHSGGYCYYYDKDGTAGTIDVDEIIGSALYADFWSKVSSTGKAPSLGVFISFYLPKIRHAFLPDTSSIEIMRDDWDSEMARLLS